jgi:hypothetical protein
MTIQLTQQESEQHFHNALCNGLGEIGYYGLDLDYDDQKYQDAKIALQTQSPTSVICHEDILMEMLKSGGTLTLLDNEDDDNEVASITISDVHERVSQTPIEHLMNAITENDDATTADVIIQTVFLNEIVYG